MTEVPAWLGRLAVAVNRHDLDALVNCFAADYENETPAHPGRSFRGRDQVRRNWEQIFASVPDVHADVRAAVFDGRTAWTEWEIRGTRHDGSAHRMTGVIVFEVWQGAAHRARFYLEPVDDGPGTVDAAVRAQVFRR